MKFVEWLEDTWRSHGYPLKLSGFHHGRLEDWLTILEKLPPAQDQSSGFETMLRIGENQVDPIQGKFVDQAIEAFIPWRKGPVSLCGREIDTEWRSDFKWARFADHVDWENRSVLDVGCGNGYFGFRALLAGARSIIGIDGYLLYVMQAALINWFMRSENVVLPLRFGSDQINGTFDIVLSLGVIYHQRDPTKHLMELYSHCNTGGQVVLESIVADQPFVPEDRYAGMRNVYEIPSVISLENKLKSVGFSDIHLVDVTKTTKLEQRKTRFMPYRSLSDALNPDDDTQTIENYPAPKRATFTARRLT